MTATNAAVSRAVRVRILVFIGVLFVVAGLIVRRAHELQVVEAEDLRSKAENQYLRHLKLPPRRGRLLDRREQELATTAEVDTLIFNPRQLAHVEGGARRLALAAGADLRELEQAQKTGRFFAYVRRGVSPAEKDRALALGLPGVAAIREPKRHYPLGELGGPVIGHTNVDGQGIEGSEMAFDEHLRGSALKVQTVRDNRGRELLFGGLVDNASTAGKDVVLSLDKTIMFIADRALRDAVNRWKAKAATAVVMDPNSGEVLALSTYPTYDPGRVGELKGAIPKNRAVTDTLEPGSTMKTFTMLAAYEAGKVRPDELIDCQMGKKLKVGKHLIGDSHPKGILTAAEVYQESSNIGTVKIARRVGKEAVHEMFTRFGFGRRTGVGLAGEVRGLLHPLKRWGEIEFATNAFGQGLTVTPLQMATAFSAIATGGVYKPPRLALRLVHPDGRSEPFVPRPDQRPEERVVKEKTARLMLEIMRGVTIKGSGTRAAIPGYPVAGKTGTAQKTAGGHYVEKYIGSFIGIAPSDRPRVVVGVWIDEPQPEHLGGLVAAPVFREITEAVLRYLTVPPSEPIVATKAKAGMPGSSGVGAGGKASGASGGFARAGAMSPGSLVASPSEGATTLAAALVASPSEAAANDAEEGPGSDEPLLVEGEGPLGELDDEEAGEVGRGREAEIMRRDELVPVPSFAGMSVGQAVRAARQAGVELVPDGSGVAVTQSPAPGLVPRGAICRVVFRPRG